MNAKIAKEQAQISIHALRVEGDNGSADRGNERANFYPRPPSGGRRSTF